jgi:hypothetical protein
LRRHGAGAYARAVPSGRLFWFVAALCGVTGCAQPPAPVAPRLWTVADLQALAASGKTAVAAGGSLPGGIPLARILNNPDGTLVQRPSLADTYAASYVTTEVWLAYPQVWVQPMYVPVSGWVNDAPTVITDAAGAWKPIFSLGATSGFYSPFWQAIYFEAPAGTTADTYTSAKQILDAGLPLHEGAGWTIPIVPPDLVWTNPAAVPGAGWVDGAPVATLNFGKRLFTWNPATNVVDERPLFVFVMRDADGNLVAPRFRTVAGTGPIGSGGLAPPKAGNQPLYSSYWRLYTVEVPPTAAVFADASLRDELAAAGLPPPPAIDPAVAAMYPGIVGRVAIDPACFDDPQQIDPQLGSCTYFDSQAAIERGIAAWAIQPTDVTVTCPVVTYQETNQIVPVL